MVYSYKTILFISTAAVSSTAYSLFLLPTLFSESFDLSLAAALLGGLLLQPSTVSTLAVKTNLVLATNGLELTLLNKDALTKTITLFLPGLDFAFLLLNFSVYFFILDLFVKIFLSSFKSFFWFKQFNFFKTNLFLSYTFMTSLDTILAFTYFFFSLYFLEVHFFFIYSFNLSSDSVVYQFNFLLSSFFFIFLVKTLRNLFEKGFLFSMNFHFNEYLVFNSSKVEETSLKSTPDTTIFEEDDLLIIGRFIIRAFFFVFFFFSTFFVWLFRFIIQFVRLLVLFMIHTIFELVIVSSDSVLVNYFLNYLFALKYLFFIFFFFGSFLYLIIYLNLMFTLQVFIFYFFSEVFQSNFVTDLSSFVATKVKKI